MKQEKHMTLIVLGVIFLFLIVGCGGGDKISGAPTTPYIGGTKDVEIKFLDGYPPAEVTDGGTYDFQIILSLINNGEYILRKEEVRAFLTGLPLRDFSQGSVDADKVIKEEDVTNVKPDGDPLGWKRDAEGNIILEPAKSFVTFPYNNKYPDKPKYFNFAGALTANNEFDFVVGVCYRYQTEAVADLCVLNNLVDVPKDAFCEPSGTKTVFNWGSPIQVTSLRQAVAGRDKMQFSFDIVHSGQGNVFRDSPSYDALCPQDRLEREGSENKVKVTVDVTTDDPAFKTLTCSGLTEITTKTNAGAVTSLSGVVRLDGGRKTITCTQYLAPARGEFQAKVKIIVDFTYLEKLKNKILVKHIT